MLFSVVSHRAWNSLSMEPLYFAASPTLLKLSSSTPSWESNGEIASIESCPNNCFNIADCLSFGKACNAFITSTIAPLASTCIRFAISVASNPNVWNASVCELVALSPAVNAKIKFFIPVAAISGGLPQATIDAPNAAISPDATPPTSPNGPILDTTSEICGAVAALVLPK